MGCDFDGGRWCLLLSTTMCCRRLTTQTIPPSLGSGEFSDSDVRFGCKVRVLLLCPCRYDNPDCCSVVFGVSSAVGGELSGPSWGCGFSVFVLQVRPFDLYTATELQGVHPTV